MLTIGEMITQENLDNPEKAEIALENLLNANALYQQNA